MTEKEYTEGQNAFRNAYAKVLREAKEISGLVDDAIKDENRETTKRLLDTIRGLARDAEQVLTHIGEFESAGHKRPSVADLVKA